MRRQSDLISMIGTILGIAIFFVAVYDHYARPEIDSHITLGMFTVAGTLMNPYGFLDAMKKRPPR